MAKRTLPDQAYLRECFDYDPESGLLTWRERPLAHFIRGDAHRRWNTRYAGRQAGLFSNTGHRNVSVNAIVFGVHRIIWKLVTGNNPPEHIDHRNHNGSDNRWENLREATYKQNNRNQIINRRNLSGLKGVSSNRHSGTSFSAKIKVDDKIIYIGTFKTPEAAHEAYCVAAREHYGEFWSAG